jgi:hypothetical protein
VCCLPHFLGCLTGADEPHLEQGAEHLVAAHVILGSNHCRRQRGGIAVLRGGAGAHAGAMLAQQLHRLHIPAHKPEGNSLMKLTEASLNIIGQGFTAI